jgi:hypothetical protein
MLAVLVASLAAACQTTREFPSSRAPAKRPANGLVVQPDFPEPWYLTIGLAKFSVQRSTERLIARVTPRQHLKVEGLRSEKGTVALAFVEKAKPKSQWGSIMTPAEREAFEAFAADGTLGKYLVVFTDVVVRGGTDPIPLTGYRWRRADVEAYADCGIPSSGLDSCTRVFYATPEMVLIPPAGTGARGG